ncbi:CDP-glycerol glycerophosphotransferase family protein [Nocardioides sp. Kera G14]|uniref:CDP-glycerol glycerophosphotransferase family protein n=1 Tax=Nocardioides sp. Kera G14 TaxID=2884264 RepID=UPI001D10E590|nr:CDP-glycerol glycerophosphotransferase family protein [Nocardioides sp. Kera G14]UDY25401.1 CDP-glycerol glycerophosphotransferase family protein [Nocardioides sp. Kera G14]
MDLARFEEAWSAFASRWAAAAPAERTALVGDVLKEGLQPGGDHDSPAPTESDRRACEMDIVKASGLFDAIGYRMHLARVGGKLTGRLPLEHFCDRGWTYLNNPTADFDLWWYWSEYLDPTSEGINPFLHFLILGRHHGLLPTQPTEPVRHEAPPLAADTRRACLFAGFDRDGIVDEYVIDYVRELSRHADVYYLADGFVSTDELAKLDGLATAAWAEAHGGDDFGSYALLASHYVGWERLEGYDEVLFANDSCYLVRPLDGVFARMTGVRTDWWGLQAAKLDFDRAHGATDPIPLERGKVYRTGAEPWGPHCRLHVGSYFLAVRRRVLTDPGFRRRLTAVAAQSQRTKSVLKYEIGLSDHLIRRGFDFRTWSDQLHPYHPLYTNEYFTLLDHGFPLLKRDLLGENPCATPDLLTWKSRIRASVPDAPVDMFERNLVRAADADKLELSFSFVREPDGSIRSDVPLTFPEFRRLEARTPTYDHWWAFPVCAYEHTFAGNERAVFEEVKDDPSIRKVILTRSRRVYAEGENVVVVPLLSRSGQELLARCGQIFVKHGPRINAHWPVPPTTHNFINLWHGTPLKRFGSAAVSISESLERAMQRNNGGSRVVIASSRMDRLAMAAAFAPLGFPDVWTTGLPRNDFVMRPDDELPADLRDTITQLRGEMAGRRLVLFLPTFKDGQADSYYHFDEEEVTRLAAWAERHNAVIGVREHMADTARTYSRLLAPLHPIDLSSRRYPDLEVLYREADALVSDYSSCLVDFMITGRPVISFAYDLDRYSDQERGLFYSLEQVLPGPVCRTFDQLEQALDGVFAPIDEAAREEYDWRRRIFHEHVDDGASWRVVQRVKELYLGEFAARS